MNRARRSAVRGPRLGPFASGRPTPDSRVGAGSGVEALNPPAAADLAVAQPVVQPVRPALPELDLHRADPKAAPPGRPGHVATGESARVTMATCSVEPGPAGQRLALSRRPGAELGPERAGLEIGVRLGRLDAVRSARTPGPGGPPSTTGTPGRPGVGGDARGPSGCGRWCRRQSPVHQAPSSSTNRLDGVSVGGRGGQRHGLGLRLPGRLGLVEPPLELADRVGMQDRTRPAAGRGPDPLKGARCRCPPRSAAGPRRCPAAAKRGATEGLRSSSAVAATTSTPSSRTRSTARSSEAPVETTSSSTTTVCTWLAGGPPPPRPPGRGPWAPCGPRTRTRPRAARPRERGRPRPWSVRRPRRRAGHDVDDPLAGLAQVRAGGDGVLAVDVVVAPAARGEPERRVPVLVAAGAHQLGEGGSGGVVEGHGGSSLRPGPDRGTPPRAAPAPGPPPSPSTGQAEVCKAAATGAGRASACTIDSIWVARVKATYRARNPWGSPGRSGPARPR